MKQVSLIMKFLRHAVFFSCKIYHAMIFQSIISMKLGRGGGG